MQSLHASWLSALCLAIQGAVVALFSVTIAWAETSVNILYFERQTPPPAVLSNLDPTPPDNGLMGARLGIADNATTGSFLGQKYNLTERIVPAEDDFNAALQNALKDDIDLVKRKMKLLP